MILYFGSFNPIHRGHIALAEYAIAKGLGDEVALVISPHNPFKQSWAQAAESDRYEMVEIACRNSKYPQQIHPSVIEFLLDRPSYTVNTLRHLVENYGSQMEFSILMGSDLINQLPRWREPEYIIDNFDLLVYPRPNHTVSFTTARTIYLADAPQFNLSSTAIRDALTRGEDTSAMLEEEVADYIRQKGLWTMAYKISALTSAITAAEQCEQEGQAQQDNRTTLADLYTERGKCHFQQQAWGGAINDFRRASELNPDNKEAKQFIEMTQEILAFRYTDIYNP